MRRLAAAVTAILYLAPSGWAEKLIYHEIRLDSSGKIEPWSGPPSQAYDHVVRLVWDFWRNMEKCGNGLPYYMQHMIWSPNQHGNGLGGDQISMAMSSWNLLYGYLGDEAVKQNMIFMADYWLDHGLSGPAGEWPNLVFPYDTVTHSGVYDGDEVAGKGVLQPDKAASFGAELVGLYKMTGNKRYLDAAVKIADTLVKHAKAGDNENSPWPYRVNAETGAVAQSKVEIEYFEPVAGKIDLKRTHQIPASYTTNWTGVLRLLGDLSALRQGDTTAYARTKTMLVTWLKTYPLQTNKWGPFFEDVPTGMWSDTEINADTLAWYILENPSWDAQWREQAKRAMEWSYLMFANRGWEGLGAIVINEQTSYKQPGNSHTSRHAAVELLYAEKTGDQSAKEAAIRRLNWATYMVDDDGRNLYPSTTRANAGKPGTGAGIWLTDGYGDYVRHYLRAMASAPKLAPGDQNHLVRTTSVCRSIAYQPASIRYSTFDREGTERFRLTRKPKRITAGGSALSERSGLAQPGWTWRAMPQGGVLDIRRTSGADVEIAIE